MMFVHTFWSKPLQHKFFGDYNTCLCVILNNYSLSFNYVKQFGYQIKLYTDKFGAELLSFLQYDDVIIIDGIDADNIAFGAQLKFHALKDCNNGEILIDGDIFLHKDKVYEILERKKEDIVYSYFENNKYITCAQEEFYQKPLDLLKEKKNHLFTIYNGVNYQLPKSIYDLLWPNTSLMKISNNELKNTYIDQYFYFKEKIKDIDFDKFWPDIFIEQYHLQHILETNKYSYSSIVDDCFTDKSELRANDIGFCHLGSYKQHLLNETNKLLAFNNHMLYQQMQKQLYLYIK